MSKSDKAKRVRDRFHESVLWSTAARVAAMMPTDPDDARHVMKTVDRLLQDRSKLLRPQRFNGKEG